MTLKPLGKVKELVESVGMTISYAYEDLVFLDHNGFLLQFGEDSDSVTVHFNSEADKKEIEQAFAQLHEAAPLTGLTILPGNFYTLHQSADETISIEFKET
jgi:hypothetical protein